MTGPNGDARALTSTPLLTFECGSLDKQGWRVKAFAGKIGRASCRERV